MNPAFQLFLIGVVTGGIFAGVTALARTLLGVAFAVMASGIVMVLADQGVEGLQHAALQLVDRALTHREFSAGVLVGALGGYPLLRALNR